MATKVGWEKPPQNRDRQGKASLRPKTARALLELATIYDINRFREVCDAQRKIIYGYK